MDDQLAFIITPPRAGSTLLSRMLAAHPAIYCRPEPHLIPPLHQTGFYGSVIDPGRQNGVVAYPPEIIRAAMNSIVAELPRGEDDYLDALRAYLNTIYGRLLAASGKQIFVDKTPGNADYTDFLLKLYPRARYVVLTRNPVQVMLSLRTLVPHMPGFVDQSSPKSYLSKAEKIVLLTLPKRLHAVAAFVRAHRVPFYHLRFEDFILSPERLGGLCAHLGVPYDPAMLDYGAATRDWVGPGDPMSVGRHQRLEETFADKWKVELRQHPERLAFVRRVLKDLSSEDIQALGYSLDEITRELDAIGP